MEDDSPHQKTNNRTTPLASATLTVSGRQSILLKPTAHILACVTQHWFWENTRLNLER